MTEGNIIGVNMRDVHKLRRTWVACMENMGDLEMVNTHVLCIVYKLETFSLRKEDLNAMVVQKWIVQRHYICVERTCACMYCHGNCCLATNPYIACYTKLLPQVQRQLRLFPSIPGVAIIRDRKLVKDLLRIS